MLTEILPLITLAAFARAQSACTLTTETHPSLSWQECTSGGCQSRQGEVVIDSNWRWTHELDSTTNCYEGNEWDSSICSDNDGCTDACCIDGADYGSTYGATASGDSLSLSFVTEHEYGVNVGSRMYLMEGSDSYQMFTLLGKEFTFDVDVSELPCGLNGALYFVSMAEDGGSGEFSTNTAGAEYGTGYCDGQCPRDLKWIAGTANVEGWTPSTNDANAGVGEMGACCAEMDIWEANSQATAYTPHTCDNNGYHSCSGDSCGGTYSAERYAGTCDPDGCDFNSYRQGDTTFYGEGSGFTVDTTRVMTVVTQFLTGSNGELSEIKRFYVQDGVVIPNSESLIEGTSGNSITPEFCELTRAAFGDRDTFAEHGGFPQMSSALAEPMVLVLSIWDDHYANMLWLDSTYPIDESGPGAERGPCPTSSGVPAEVEAESPNAKVVFSNIRFGDIDSTFGEGTGSPTTTGGSSNPTSGGGSVPQWGQCGGINYSGSTSCASGFTCVYLNDWYSQCQ